MVEKAGAGKIQVRLVRLSTSEAHLSHAVSLGRVLRRNAINWQNV